MDSLINTVPIINISGISGSGKSYFIADFCYANFAKFSNYIWYDCRLNDSEETLISYLVENGFSIKGNSIRSQVKHLCSFLEEQRVLLILDDFETVEQSNFDFLLNEFQKSKEMTRVITISGLSAYPVSFSKDLQMPDGYEEEEVIQLFKQRNIPITAVQLQDLKRLTNYLPIGVDFLISSVSDTEIKLDFELSNDASAIFNKWRIKLEDTIDPNLFILIKYLSHVEGVLQFDLVKAIHDKLNLSFNPTNLYYELTRPLIFRLYGNNRLKLNALLANYYKTNTTSFEQEDIFNTIASYYRDVIEKIGKENLMTISFNLINAIEYYHKAENYHNAQKLLLNYSSVYKHTGQYKTFLPLLKFQIDNNLDRDSWIDFHYSHISYIVGNWRECIEHLRPLLFTSYFSTQKPLQEQIQKEIKIYILYTELLSSSGKSRQAIQPNLCIRNLKWG